MRDDVRSLQLIEAWNKSKFLSFAGFNLTLLIIFLALMSEFKEKEIPKGTKFTRMHLGNDKMQIKCLITCLLYYVTCFIHR